MHPLLTAGLQQSKIALYCLPGGVRRGFGRPRPLFLFRRCPEYYAKGSTDCTWLVALGRLRIDLLLPRIAARTPMQVLEGPLWRDWPIPPLGPERYGHFVLLRLDPLASVAALEDEEASRAATPLTGNWCLAVLMANGMKTLWNPGGIAKLQFRFCLACAGPPDPGHVFVPIAPAPQVSDGRPPVQLTSPLPWPSIYVHTCCSYYAVVSRIHHGAGHFPCSFSAEQHKELDILSIKDRYLKEHAALMAEGALDDEYGQAASSDDEGRSESEDLDSVNSSEDDFFLTDEMQDKLSRVDVFVEMCLDPAACQGQPANPFELEEQSSQLEEIWREWKKRMVKEAMAKRPQTIEWIRGVDLAQSDRPEISVEPRVHTPPLDDDDILPEDASGHRVEQARAVPVVTDAHPTTRQDGANNGRDRTNSPEASNLNLDPVHRPSRIRVKTPLASTRKLVAGLVRTVISVFHRRSSPLSHSGKKK